MTQQNTNIHQPSNPALKLDSYVLVNMFDQTITGSPGVICGSGRTKKGEDIFLVQMLDTDLAGRGKQDGSAQIQHGKEWVLSLYEAELTPTTRQAAENALDQAQTHRGSHSDNLAQTGQGR